MMLYGAMIVWMAGAVVNVPQDPVAVTIKRLEKQIQSCVALLYDKDSDPIRNIHAIEQTVRNLEGLGKQKPHEENGTLWRAVGLGRSFLGDAARAEDAFLRARKTLPGDAKIRLFLGRVYVVRSIEVVIRTGEKRRADLADRWSKAAVPHLKFAINAQGLSELEICLAKAYLALARNEKEAARRICAEGFRVLGNVQGTEELWLVQAFATGGRERVWICAQAIEQRPHYGWAYFLRGVSRHSSGDRAGAIVDYTQAIKMQPRFLESYVNRGRILQSLERLKEAAANYATALHLAPRNWSDRKRVEGFLQSTGVEKAGPIVDPISKAQYSPKAYNTRRIHKSPSREVWSLDPKEIEWVLKNSETILRYDLKQCTSTNTGLRVDVLPLDSFLYSRGLRRGDVIWSLSGRRIRSALDLRKEWRPMWKRRRVVFVIKRRGRNVVMEFRAHRKR